MEKCKIGIDCILVSSRYSIGKELFNYTIGNASHSDNNEVTLLYINSANQRNYCKILKKQRICY